MTPERFKHIKHILNRRQTDLTVLLENIHKPHNLAAIIRTADATGLLNVNAIGDRYAANRRPKAASGSKRWVNTCLHATPTEAITTLKQQGHTIVVADPCESSIDYVEYDYCQPTAVVFGSELTGLSEYAQEHADVRIHVPMQGFTESLNVSVSAALILYEAMRQRLNKGMYEKSGLTAEQYELTLFEWTWPRVAGHCREKGIPYPSFNCETGEIEGSINAD